MCITGIPYGDISEKSELVARAHSFDSKQAHVYPDVHSMMCIHTTCTSHSSHKVSPHHASKQARVAPTASNSNSGQTASAALNRSASRAYAPPPSAGTTVPRAQEGYHRPPMGSAAQGPPKVLYQSRTTVAAGVADREDALQRYPVRGSDDSQLSVSLLVSLSRHSH